MLGQPKVSAPRYMPVVRHHRGVGQGILVVTPELGPGANFRSKHTVKHCGRQERKSSCSEQTGKAKETTLTFLSAPIPTHHGLYAKRALLEMKASNNLV